MPDAADATTAGGLPAVVAATLRALGTDPTTTDPATLPALVSVLRFDRDRTRNRYTAVRAALEGYRQDPLRARIEDLARHLRCLAVMEGEIGGDDDDGESDQCDSPAECHASGRMRAYQRAAMEVETLLTPQASPEVVEKS